VLFGASAFAAVRIFVERLAPTAAPSDPRRSDPPSSLSSFAS
jgi:hypothetical protein